MTVHICAPAPERVWLERGTCPNCGPSRRFVVSVYEWYSGEMTCLRCGDSYGEDGRMERPFERGWRRKAIRAAWAHYRRWHATAERCP